MSAYDAILRGALELAVPVFGGGALLKFILERRTAKARGNVAESTVELQIDATRLANLEKRLELTVEAHNSERESWQNERESLKNRIALLEEEKAELHDELTITREQVKAMQAELNRIQTRLDQRLDPH